MGIGISGISYPLSICWMPRSYSTRCAPTARSLHLTPVAAHARGSRHQSRVVSVLVTMPQATVVGYLASPPLV